MISRIRSGVSPESRSVIRARQKIEKQLAKSDARLTPAAIAAMTLVIKGQIAARSPERIKIRAKTQQITPKSKIVGRLMSKLKLAQNAESRTLEGRVKTL